MGAEYDGPRATWCITELLSLQPGLRVQPEFGDSVAIEGAFRIDAQYGQYRTVVDTFEIRIEIPFGYPECLPAIFEIGHRIPTSFHKNRDTSLCLGPPIRLFMELRRSNSLVSYIEKCLVPYLYQYTFAERREELPLGDLPHGALGVIVFYRGELRMPTLQAALDGLQLLGVAVSGAYEKPCPCGSGRRLGSCHSYFFDKLRGNQHWTWFRTRYRELEVEARRQSLPLGFHRQPEVFGVTLRGQAFIFESSKRRFGVR